MERPMPSLCQVCRNALQFRQGLLKEESDSLFLGHHVNVQSLIFSANAQCFVCRTIWDDLPPAERSRIMQPLPRP
jgi:hypothetical protein